MAEKKLAGIGQYQTVDPAFTPNKAAEKAAMQNLGLTKEYIESRGGVNASGYYGDSWNANLNLTDAEYQAAVRGKTGVEQGKAINAAQEAKQAAYYGTTGDTTGGTTGGVGGGLPGGPMGGAPVASALKTEAQIAAETKAAEQKAERQSAYDLLYSQFAQYGLKSLVEPLKNLITSGASPEEFTIKLRESEPYRKRFGANAERIKKGLTAINEATYLGLEDQYQEIMRNYGLPASYYSKGDLGVQEGFTNLIANDVSAAELEDRVMTAQQRVLNSNPEVLQAIKDFYGDSITNGDILSYTLNPEKGLEDIKRKVTAAEIGGAALAQGLATSAAGAEELAGYGVTKAQAQQGFADVAQMAPRGSALSEIYNEAPYNQATATAEVFGTAGAADATQKRKKLTALEQATFGGQSGLAQGALARNGGGGAF